MTALRFQTGGRHQTSPASLRGKGTWRRMDMVVEQTKDYAIRKIKEQFESEKANRALKKRCIVMDGLLYYLSDPDDDATVRLYVPEQIQDAVIRQYHDENGHVGIDKTFEAT